MDAPAKKVGSEKRLTRKDFQSDREIRWCPGCGDYSILAQFQKVLAELDVPREEHVIVSGIGCASRFPYYMNTYGIHSIHGRAPAVATGIKLMRPELTVWVATGDGDALSIGGNHLIHALRRNVDIKILLFNNRVYGLTKGQYSPTSPQGAQMRSTPAGSVDYPLHPLRLAAAAGASFIARTLDSDPKHMQQVLTRAAHHRGAAFVEIYQNCPIYNDDAHVELADRNQRDENGLYLKQAEPLVFGDGGTKAIALDGLQPKLVRAGSAGVLKHDEHDEGLLGLLTRLEGPGFPIPVGVFYDVQQPSFDEMANAQVSDARRSLRPDLQTLLNSGTTWTVE